VRAGACVGNVLVNGREDGVSDAFGRFCEFLDGDCGFIGLETQERVGQSLVEFFPVHVVVVACWAFIAVWRVQFERSQYWSVVRARASFGRICVAMDQVFGRVFSTEYIIGSCPVFCSRSFQHGDVFR
jgi:hypothetical protein